MAVIADALLSFAGSMCAGVLFNTGKDKLAWTGVSGMIGWIVYAFFQETTGNIFVSTFMGAAAVGFFSELMARILKSPATVFSIPGIFPLVPGIAAYNTVQLIVENKLYDALGKAVETLGSAGAIAFGIMVVTALFRFAGKQ